MRRRTCKARDTVNPLTLSAPNIRNLENKTYIYRQRSQTGNIDRFDPQFKIIYLFFLIISTHFYCLSLYIIAPANYIMRISSKCRTKGVSAQGKAFRHISPQVLGRV